MPGARLRWAVSAALLLAVFGAGSSGATGLPPPTFGRSVDIGLVSGVVLIVPSHGASFQLGPEDRNIPVGSRIDTRNGKVDLRTAYAPASGRKGVQDGQFTGGQFTIRQPTAQQGLAVLDLMRPADAGLLCAQAGAARVSQRVLALLHSTAHGAFRTRGHFSAATARGTAWDTIDRCDGTLTRVRRGVVSVLDFARHRTVIARMGQSYLATA